MSGVSAATVIAGIGAAATVASATGMLGGGKGGGGSQPQVVSQSPLKDQAAIDAEALTKSAQARADRKRRVRASSLLATGGAGDTTDVVTGQPTAIAAKSTLGE